MYPLSALPVVGIECHLVPETLGPGQGQGFAVVRIEPPVNAVGQVQRAFLRQTLPHLTRR